MPKLCPDRPRRPASIALGPVELVALGNANPRGIGSFRQSVAKIWHSRALAVLRLTGELGLAGISIESDGPQSAQMSVTVDAAAQRIKFTESCTGSGRRWQL